MSTIQTNKQELLSFKIIIKIAVITGVPNVLAFINVFISNGTIGKDIFEMLYSLVYGLQGKRYRKILYVTLVNDSLQYNNFAFSIYPCPCQFL